MIKTSVKKRYPSTADLQSTEDYQISKITRLEEHRKCNEIIEKSIEYRITEHNN